MAEQVQSPLVIIEQFLKTALNHPNATKHQAKITKLQQKLQRRRIGPHQLVEVLIDAYSIGAGRHNFLKGMIDALESSEVFTANLTAAAIVAVTPTKKTPQLKMLQVLLTQAQNPEDLKHILMAAGKTKVNLPHIPKNLREGLTVQVAEKKAILKSSPMKQACLQAMLQQASTVDAETFEINELCDRFMAEGIFPIFNKTIQTTKAPQKQKAIRDQWTYVTDARDGDDVIARLLVATNTIDSRPTGAVEQRLAKPPIRFSLSAVATQLLTNAEYRDIKASIDETLSRYTQLLTNAECRDIKASIRYDAVHATDPIFIALLQSQLSRTDSAQETVGITWSFFMATRGHLSVELSMALTKPMLSIYHSTEFEFEKELNDRLTSNFHALKTQGHHFQLSSALELDKWLGNTFRRQFKKSIKAADKRAMLRAIPQQLWSDLCTAEEPPVDALCNLHIRIQQAERTKSREALPWIEKLMQTLKENPALLFLLRDMMVRVLQTYIRDNNSLNGNQRFAQQTIDRLEQCWSVPNTLAVMTQAVVILMDSNSKTLKKSIKDLLAPFTDGHAEAKTPTKPRYGAEDTAVVQEHTLQLIIPAQITPQLLMSSRRLAVWSFMCSRWVVERIANKIQAQIRNLDSILGDLLSDEQKKLIMGIANSHTRHTGANVFDLLYFLFEIDDLLKSMREMISQPQHGHSDAVAEGVEGVDEPTLNLGFIQLDWPTHQEQQKIQQHLLDSIQRACIDYLDTNAEEYATNYKYVQQLWAKLKLNQIPCKKAIRLYNDIFNSSSNTFAGRVVFYMLNKDERRAERIQKDRHIARREGGETRDPFARRRPVSRSTLTWPKPAVTTSHGTSNVDGDSKLKTLSKSDDSDTECTLHEEPSRFDLSNWDGFAEHDKLFFEYIHRLERVAALGILSSDDSINQGFLHLWTAVFDKLYEYQIDKMNKEPKAIKEGLEGYLQEIGYVSLDKDDLAGSVSTVISKQNNRPYAKYQAHMKVLERLFRTCEDHHLRLNLFTRRPSWSEKTADDVRKFDLHLAYIRHITKGLINSDTVTLLQEFIRQNPVTTNRWLKAFFTAPFLDSVPPPPTDHGAESKHNDPAPLTLSLAQHRERLKVRMQSDLGDITPPESFVTEMAKYDLPFMQAAVGHLCTMFRGIKKTIKNKQRIKAIIRNLNAQQNPEYMYEQLFWCYRSEAFSYSGNVLPILFNALADIQGLSPEKRRQWKKDRRKFRSTEGNGWHQHGYYDPILDMHFDGQSAQRLRQENYNWDMSKPYTMSQIGIAVEFIGGLAMSFERTLMTPTPTSQQRQAANYIKSINQVIQKPTQPNEWFNWSLILHDIMQCLATHFPDRYLEHQKSDDIQALAMIDPSLLEKQVGDLRLGKAADDIQVQRQYLARLYEATKQFPSCDFNGQDYRIILTKALLDDSRDMIDSAFQRCIQIFETTAAKQPPFIQAFKEILKYVLPSSEYTAPLSRSFYQPQKGELATTSSILSSNTVVEEDPTAPAVCLIHLRNYLSYLLSECTSEVNMRAIKLMQKDLMECTATAVEMNQTVANCIVAILNSNSTSNKPKITKGLLTWFNAPQTRPSEGAESETADAATEFLTYVDSLDHTNQKWLKDFKETLTATQKKRAGHGRNMLAIYKRLRPDAGATSSKKRPHKTPVTVEKDSTPKASFTSGGVIKAQLTRELETCGTRSQAEVARIISELNLIPSCDIAELQKYLARELQTQHRRGSTHISRIIQRYETQLTGTTELLKTTVDTGVALSRSEEALHPVTAHYLKHLPEPYPSAKLWRQDMLHSSGPQSDSLAPGSMSMAYDPTANLAAGLLHLLKAYKRTRGGFHTNKRTIDSMLSNLEITIDDYLTSKIASKPGITHSKRRIEQEINHICTAIISSDSSHLAPKVIRLLGSAFTIPGPTIEMMIRWRSNFPKNSQYRTCFMDMLAFHIQHRHMPSRDVDMRSMRKIYGENGKLQVAVVKADQDSLEAAVCQPTTPVAAPPTPQQRFAALKVLQDYIQRGGVSVDAAREMYALIALSKPQNLYANLYLIHAVIIKSNSKHLVETWLNGLKGILPNIESVQTVSGVPYTTYIKKLRIKTQKMSRDSAMAKASAAGRGYPTMRHRDITGLTCTQMFPSSFPSNITDWLLQKEQHEHNFSRYAEMHSKTVNAVWQSVRVDVLIPPKPDETLSMHLPRLMRHVCYSAAKVKGSAPADNLLARSSVLNTTPKPVDQSLHKL